MNKTVDSSCKVRHVLKTGLRLDGQDDELDDLDEELRRCQPFLGNGEIIDAQYLPNTPRYPSRELIDMVQYTHIHMDLYGLYPHDPHLFLLNRCLILRGLAGFGTDIPWMTALPSSCWTVRCTFKDASGGLDLMSHLSVFL